MDVNAILFELYSELRRVDRAILALQQLGPFGKGHGANPLSTAARGGRPARASELQQRLIDLGSDPFPHPS